MTTCAGCGDCCNPVIIEADVYFRCGERARSEELPSGNDRFITQHWRPISAWTAEDGTWCISARCDMFDPDSLACTAYDSRPPVCSGFPWYGDRPGPARAEGLLPHCSYLADLPPGQRPQEARPLIPLTVTAR